MVAKAIQSGIESAAGQCDLIKIKEFDPKKLAEYDLIGIGSPIYGFAEPENIQYFIKEIEGAEGKHVFPFATHGTCPEYYYPSIVPKLTDKGMVVIGLYNCYGTVYMMGSPNPYPTDGHPDDIDLQEAKGFGIRMVERSQRISAGETGLLPKIPVWAKADLKKYIADRDIKEEEMGVKIKTPLKPMMNYDREKCRYPKCSLCMTGCPVNGIDLSKDPPVLASPCMMCRLCTDLCPTGAMERTMTMPKLSKRWEMTKSYYLDPLAQAELEGRFRRLVPLEKIGWDTPLTTKDEKYERSRKFAIDEFAKWKI